MIGSGDGAIDNSEYIQVVMKDGTEHFGSFVDIIKLGGIPFFVMYERHDDYIRNANDAKDLYINMDEIKYVTPNPIEMDGEDEGL